MFRLSFAALALASVAAPALAQTAPKPKLIVAIAVDQLSSDVFSEYRGQFKGGFKRLAEGVVFPRGHQSHAATETCPGHSTILTGSRPSRSGIIANDWQDPTHARTTKAGKTSYEVYCAEDPKAEASDFMSSSQGYLVSPHFLKVPTLGDRMKAATPATRVIAISQKDRAAVMMGGHKTDLALWFDGKSFVTFPGSKAVLPKALGTVNAALSKEIATGGTSKLPAFCNRATQDIKVGTSVTLGRLAPRRAGNARDWLSSPASDSATLKLAVAALNEFKLGKGDATDILAVSFSASDYVGHTYGTEGPEMCNQILALDATLGQLFAALDKAKVDYAVSLTADHGGHDIPERNRIQGLPAAQRVDVMLSALAVGTMLQKKHGLSEPALLGRAPFGDMYLSPTIPAEKRDAVLADALAMYRAHRQVEAVFTATELAAAPAPDGPVDEWTLLERAKASFHAGRSGDFQVLLKPYVTPIPDGTVGYYATHGSPWGYDRRVPILFWWRGVKGFEQPNAVETVDIMPTWAGMIGLPVPASEIDGRCLDVVAGEASNCGG